MIEGPSGIRAVSSEEERPKYSMTRRRLLWPNGAEGFVFSAEDPDSLRGPQFDAAWCDEIGAWAKDEKTWTRWRSGCGWAAPRISATTTPRARKLAKRLLDLVEAGQGRGALTRAATRDNAANLAEGFVEDMTASYGSSSLGPQELLGRVCAGRPGRAVDAGDDRGCACACGGWASSIASSWRSIRPAGVGRDACGIVAAGVRGGVIYVLRDASVRGMRPLEWAGRIVAGGAAGGGGADRGGGQPGRGDGAGRAAGGRRGGAWRG